MVCLDPSNNRTPKTKVNRVLLDSLGINQRLDRRILPRQGSHNRVDVRHHSIVYLNITNAQYSIWQYSDPTAQHRIVWQSRRKRSVREHSAARYAAASWPTVRLRPVRKQVDHPNSWGRNLWQQPYQPNGYDLCPNTTQPFRKRLWTVGFSAGEQHIWECNQPLRSPVCNCSWCDDIQHTTPRKLHVG